MREAIKDPGRIKHILDMALFLEKEREKHTLDSIKMTLSFSMVLSK